MSITNGHKALINRIAQMSTTANIQFPNGPNVAMPRYVIQTMGGRQRTATISGTTESYPEILVHVETDERYVNENDTMVEDLVSLFAVNVRFDGVTILNAPEVGGRLGEQKGAYSVPVTIRGFYPF